jgi:predicted nucleic acid-binding protein
MEMGLPTSGNFGMNGMTESRFVLDTNAVISFTADGNVIPAESEGIFDEAELFISIIADSVSVVDINSAIKKQTIDLRRSTKIKLPDCIIAATSIVLNAVLLTNDDKLLKLTCPGYRARNLCEAAEGEEP